MLFWLGWMRCSLSWAQSPTGVWTFQQLGIGLDQKDHWQLILISQPRFTNKWETILGVGKLGYRLHPQHVAFLGVQWVEFYDPRRLTQKRLFQRWQWTPSQAYALTLTLEERWQNGRFGELLFRSLSRYRWGVGPVWLSITSELFISTWSPQRHWSFYPRQHRTWLTISYPRSKSWQVETGYLHIAIPRTAPRHRLWVAGRAYISRPKR